jgi:hypothetical protein
VNANPSENKTRSIFEEVETGDERKGVGNLLNGDLLASLLLGLGDQDRQDAVLHGSMNSVLINTDGEAEGAGELANATLRDPVFLLMLLVGGGGLGVLLGNLGGGGFGIFVLDGSLMSLLGDGTFSSGCLDETSGTSAGFVFALSTALDRKSIGVGEFDLDVLLVDAGKLAMEFVSVLDLSEIKLWGEGFQMSASGGAVNIAGVLVELIEHTEERVERGGWVIGDKASWEKRHLA